MRLLWTHQTQTLWQEFSTSESRVKVQILAGPSGIGKSHISLLLALRAYSERLPVLYVPDAGNLLARCMMRRTPGPISGFIDAELIGFIDAELLRIFAVLNADIAMAVSAHDLSTVSLMQLLHSLNAVAIIDEHGHAFNMLTEAGLLPAIHFPMLMPNSYLDANNIRCVYAGSNQARFEIDLNDTYKRNLRFVVPFTESEARQFLVELKTITLAAASAGSSNTVVPVDTGVSDEACASYENLTNFVPREMKYLFNAVSESAYVTVRKGDISTELKAMLTALRSAHNDYAVECLVSALGDFFRTSSMALGTNSCSFLDVGCVFRRGDRYEGITFFPTCRPALLSLLDFRNSLTDQSSRRLVSVRDNGDEFEEAIWEKLLTSFSSDDGLNFRSRFLGKPPYVYDTISLRPTSYAISKLDYPSGGLDHVKQNALNREIKHFAAVCNRRQGTMLYRCPKNAADIDFIILYRDSTCDAIQASISVLTEHSSGSRIDGLPTRYGMKPSASAGSGGRSRSASESAAGSGVADMSAALPPPVDSRARARISGSIKPPPSEVVVKLARFIYITVKPEDHGGLASRPYLTHVRIVDAEDLFGKA